MDRRGAGEQAAELVLYLMAVPIGLQILLWVLLGTT